MAVSRGWIGEHESENIFDCSPFVSATPATHSDETRCAWTCTPLVVFVNLLIALWVALPWLAPVFVRWGWTQTAQATYFFYAFQCHQLPERSFFLFGKQAMYSWAEIQAAGANITNPLFLRQFIGNAELGWKVAWSDRMVAMYTSLLLFSLLFGMVGKRLRPLPLWGFALLLLPMAVDGGTHLISDLAGIGQGFRDTNIWLQTLTNNTFSTVFYQGDALGSFNSRVRLITGVLFGIALVEFAFPYINDSFAEIVHRSEVTLRKGLEQ